MLASQSVASKVSIMTNIMEVMCGFPYLRHLPERSRSNDQNHRNEREPVRAGGMSREDVESDRNTQDSRSSQQYVSNDEQRTRDLSRDRSANHFRHIGNTVASTMVVAEISLDDSCPRVKKSPTENTERATDSSQIVHRSWDSEDSDSKDDFQKDDRCSRPFDCAEVDTSSSLEDFELFVVVRIENPPGSRSRRIVLDVGLCIVLGFLLLWCVHCEERVRDAEQDLQCKRPGRRRVYTPQWPPRPIYYALIRFIPLVAKAVQRIASTDSP
jgi:hypothetical protein